MSKAPKRWIRELPAGRSGRRDSDFSGTSFWAYDLMLRLLRFRGTLWISGFQLRSSTSCQQVGIGAFDVCLFVVFFRVSKICNHSRCSERVLLGSFGGSGLLWRFGGLILKFVGSGLGLWVHQWAFRI